jgi:uncharacterized RDD family membrane protein YckC
MAADSVPVLSPEGVALELPIAGPGPRILAYSVDAVLSMIIGMVLLFSLVVMAPVMQLFSDLFEPFTKTLEEDPQNQEAILMAMLPLLLLFVLLVALSEIIYFTFFELVTGGRSPGKMLMGLRVTSDSGLPLDARSSLIRNVLRLVDVLPSSYATGLTAMMLSQRWQRLGDMAAGTVVVRTDRLEPESDLDVGEAVEPLRLTREQLSRVGADELALVRGTLRRLGRVDAERAALLVSEAVAALRQHLQLDAEDTLDEDGTLFLRRLLAAADVETRRR